MSRDVIERYYAAFNAGDTDAMLALLTDDVEHHVNQGGIRRGKSAFSDFCAHMAATYREELTDMVILTEPTGRRAAAEFTVNGAYLATDEDLPEARGQTYVLPAGAFFELRDGQISRVTTYYNLEDWIAQVSL
ncbi:isopropylmalate/homocitrate/citramalate synthase [Maritimibacter sp. 55A14]|uniref:ketosteroid isomerase-related protein n=1 Tax=Maritimibacter sp. 55A14 TaxID=2174844 RepID=UPI000D615111|nr:ketosteroid isomerase-related protein [Maritimibacter sp. 55A14]PWE32181.1 isopropylmalate/homocitrate/citramalate synthase [Maritimibacter sp. 55A14]